ncbi:MAG TPA: hypothetical protein VMY37_17215 [Thermoguttaceae bacterium]|nr:hypothetical protein [Thermoguttaceae bacterium]
MARFFYPLILMLARLGKSEPARQIRYLKAENEMRTSSRSTGICGMNS